MLDRRREQRYPAYFGGTISFNRRLSVADCVVKNTSRLGAKLVFHNTTFVPAECDLAVRTSPPNSGCAGVGSTRRA